MGGHGELVVLTSFASHNHNGPASDGQAKSRENSARVFSGVCRRPLKFSLSGVRIARVEAVRGDSRWVSGGCSPRAGEELLVGVGEIR